MSAINTISTHTSDTQLNNAATQKEPYVGISPHASSLTPSTPDPNRPRRPKQRRRNISVGNLNEYFTGPRDVERHSKLPYFLRMQGSITPKMLVPLVVVGCWATLITCISHFIYPLEVSTVLLGVLGFVVGLAISFRTSSAYERYVEGRKYWAQLIQASRDLARHIWVHAEERHEEDAETGKADLLAKLTALNLIVAFAVALKHKLRFEPYTNYRDLDHLVSHISTFAGAATDRNNPVAPKKKSTMKETGEYLGLSFAESNPRKLIKRADKNLGNLPLEILNHLSVYMNSIMANDTLKNGVYQGMVMGNLASLNEVLAGTERVLNTPLPIAYSIAISQITWVYVMMLPFQLWATLRWITIPGTVVAAYIIIGIAQIGSEIENPFGVDVNDLPLDHFCKQLAAELDVIASAPPPRAEDFIASKENRVLFSLSYAAWQARSTEDIRATLKAKASAAPVAEEPQCVKEKDLRVEV